MKSWPNVECLSLKCLIRQGRKERGKEAGPYPYKQTLTYVHQTAGNAVIAILQVKNLKVRLGNFFKVRWVNQN